eukprot:COSAG02_NODE_6556_length_3499_cov_1.878235_2_plen_74_part_00
MPARSLEMMSQDRAMPLLATWTTVELLSKAPISKFQNLHHKHAQLGTTFAKFPWELPLLNFPFRAQICEHTAM